MMHIVRHGSGKRLLLSVGDDIAAPESFTVIAVTDVDWNRYLSPWPAPKVFAKGEDFGGLADEFLEEMLKQLQDVLQEDWEDRNIIGYSLAGLFALYACTKTDVFGGCASVSGSMWYPGFTDYLKEHPVHCRRVVLSLGEKQKILSWQPWQTGRKKCVHCFRSTPIHNSTGIPAITSSKRRSGSNGH